MSDSSGVGERALERIAAVWQVDPDRIVRTEHGFDWWPSRFRVSVTAQQGDTPETEETFRIQVRTEFLKSVDVESPAGLVSIEMFSSLAPCYAWVFTPPEVLRKYERPIDGAVYLQSTWYLRPDTEAWLPEFIAKLAILQAVDAHELAENTAKLLRATPHVSGPGDEPADDHLDELVGGVRAIYGGEGQRASRWVGCDEFGQFAEQYGQGEQCLGNGDGTGLTLETPIGDDTALIRLQTDIAHPRLGSGLLASVQMPIPRSRAETSYECAWLNFFESIQWTDLPQIGSWHARERGEGLYVPALGSFFPNALHTKGMATTAAFWQFGRARWAKAKVYSKLQDVPMSEIYARRFGTARGN